MSIAPADTAALTEKIRESSLAVTALLAEVRKVIVGQPKMVERLAIGLLADGHLYKRALRIGRARGHYSSSTTFW